MIEEWKDIEEVADHQISNKGRIRRNNLYYSTFVVTKYGKAIYLSVNSKATLFYINELVEKYFGNLESLTSRPSNFNKVRKKRECCGRKKA